MPGGRTAHPALGPAGICRRPGRVVPDGRRRLPRGMPRRRRSDPAPIERRRDGRGRAWRPLRHRDPARRRGARALTSGPGARLTSSSGSPRPSAAPRASVQAFSVAATWSSDGRKFGGSAQRRLKSWFMVHCSILYDFPIERIDRYLKMPRRQPEYRAGRSHGDFLSTCRCLVTSSRIPSGTHFPPARATSCVVPCRRRSWNPSCPRNSRTGSGSSGSEPSEL